MSIFSSREQLEKIAEYLSAYMRIPYFQDETVPGKIMEKIISLVHSAEQLSNYDYIDVCKRGNVGWQIKSTKDGTPLTWKRAKIANSDSMIKSSLNDDVSRQKLGDAVIDFCNNHVHESYESYNLKEIGYSRLIMFDDRSAIYFEKVLSNLESKDIFKKENYEWNWSEQKTTFKKEQLPALHGKDLRTGKKAFAWHGRGEN